MKNVFALSMLTLMISNSAFTAINCEDLDKQDSRVLCRQNQKILSVIKQGNSGQTLLKCSAQCGVAGYSDRGPKLNGIGEKSVADFQNKCDEWLKKHRPTQSYVAEVKDLDCKRI